MKYSTVFFWHCYLISQAKSSGVSDNQITFKQVESTLGHLEDPGTFKAASKVECGSICSLALEYDMCTAFHFDPAGVGVCTCGKKSTIPEDYMLPSVMMHVNILCGRMPSLGKGCMYVWKGLP